MTHKERAIAIIEESRRTHVEAIRWIKSKKGKTPQARQMIYGAEDGFCVGSVAFHRKCIRGYDAVLRYLRKT